jgi:hypothetical protein
MGRDEEGKRGRKGGKGGREVERKEKMRRERERGCGKVDKGGKGRRKGIEEETRHAEIGTGV